MISQQSAIAHGPGLLLQRNSTYDISLLQRGQSVSSLGLKESKWNSLGEFRAFKWLICLIKQHVKDPHGPKGKRGEKELASQKHDATLNSKDFQTITSAINLNYASNSHSFLNATRAFPAKNLKLNICIR